MTTAQGNRECKYYDCTQAIPLHDAWRPKHFQETQHEKIDTCPERHRDKRVGQITCPDYRDNQEGIPEWRYNPPGADVHHVYTLKTDDGRFYVGQTTGFEETVGDHIHGRIPETGRRNPKFV